MSSSPARSTSPTRSSTPVPATSKLRLSTVTSTNISSLKRLNSLLLPIPYSPKFYSEILTDNSVASLTRLAYWDGDSTRSNVAVGAVRARYEPATEELETGKVYIMTLCVLSPFRRLGIGKALVDRILDEARQWDVKEVYAHVWEENEDALEWYRSLGFEVEETVQRDYYRRLKPNGARIVRCILA